MATNVEIRGIDDFRTSPFIGCGILGPNASDLSAEAALTIEMGADAPDIGLTIHPHPTLSETIGMAAEAFEARSPTPKGRRRNQRRKPTRSGRVRG